MAKQTYTVMRDKFGAGDGYDTPAVSDNSRPSSLPASELYMRVLFGPLRRLSWVASRGKCDDIEWVNGSAWCADILEKIGCHFFISGQHNINKEKSPCVFIGNHMSTLETFILPAIVRPRRPVTFVVKKSLVEMPFFGPIMRSRDPVVVGRINPREDLATVLNEGQRILASGISIIVFPQHTRSLKFEPEHFNSIGIKLARKANVPVVPLALKTDAWGQGKKIKELGRIRPDLPIRFKFGEPMAVEGNGRSAHDAICDFIANNLADWQQKDGVNQ